MWICERAGTGGGAATKSGPGSDRACSGSELPEPYCKRTLGGLDRYRDWDRIRIQIWIQSGAVGEDSGTISSPALDPGRSDRDPIRARHNYTENLASSRGSAELPEVPVHFN